MHDRDTSRSAFELRMALLRLKGEIAALTFLRAGRRLVDLLREQRYSPFQLRVPAGQSDGGQWTSDDGRGGAEVIPVGARGRTTVPVPINGRVLPATPGQVTRLTVAQVRAEAAARQVSELDPTWAPRASLSDPTSLEGVIRQTERQAIEAEARLAQIYRDGLGGNQGPSLLPSGPAGSTGTAAQPLSPIEVIGAYRSITRMPETIGGIAVAKSDRTVAYAEVDGRPVIGISSNAAGYTVADEIAARDLRGKLIEQYPDVMNTKYISRMPNDALFHAEANALIRAAEGSGGSLDGRVIEMTVDRRLCGNCDKVLPLVGLQLGNPTVRITDSTGAVWIMRDGAWMTRGRQ